MTKIVFNECYGGFGLSEAALEMYKELGGTEEAWDIPRACPILVQVVETLGESVNTSYSSLKIAEVPEGTLYRIDEYDGFESVMTQDDYDWKTA